MDQVAKQPDDSNAALRRILLSILFHTIDSNASNKYLDNQLKAAGATQEEIRQLGGDE